MDDRILIVASAVVGGSGLIALLFHRFRNREVNTSQPNLTKVNTSQPAAYDIYHDLFPRSSYDNLSPRESSEYAPSDNGSMDETYLRGTSWNSVGGRKTKRKYSKRKYSKRV